MARLHRGLAIGEIGILGLSLHGSNLEPLMSALGQKQKLKRLHSMSALPPKADMDHSGCDVRYVPKADIGLEHPKGLWVHPFDPLCAPGARLERIRKILCFPCNLAAAELHNAHGVGRLTVICQDVFGYPKITAANDSPHSETLFTRLLSACDLYVASTADSLA